MTPNMIAYVRACFRQSGMTGGGVSRIVYRFWVMSNIVSRRRIRAARMLAGLTQADLARAAGCHPRSVRYWENKGSNAPTNVASTCGDEGRRGRTQNGHCRKIVTLP